MEKTVEIIIWSDNSELEQIANIIHDYGYHTAEIRKEELGAYENACNWGWCKANMMDSVCVDLHTALGKIVPTAQVEEMPLFRYVALFIIGEDDTDDELVMDMEDTAEEEETVNVTLNIGCTTKYGDVMNTEHMIDTIGCYHNCTITKCVGFYKGQRENSLKVEIYGVSISKAIDYASFWARCFKQECVALSIKDTTVFVKGIMSDDEHNAMVVELTK